jgi:hypothetical protein
MMPVEYEVRPKYFIPLPKKDEPLLHYPGYSISQAPYFPAWLGLLVVTSLLHYNRGSTFDLAAGDAPESP